MATKSDSKENLVTSSMMLVNNSVSDNMSSYYPGSPCTAQPSTSSDTTEELGYMYHDYYSQHARPFSYGTYYPYTYGAMEGAIATSQNCTCRNVPVQETFLHQILSGKGYKHNQLCVTVRPVIKQERVYHDYCCYGYPSGSYGYPVYY